MLTRCLFRASLIAAAALCATVGLAETTVGSLEPAAGTWRAYRGTGFATPVCSASSEADVLKCAAGDAERRSTTTRYQIRYPNRYVTATYKAAPPPDSDGDGVPDSRDKCPTVRSATADGCPAMPPPPSPDVIWRSDLTTTGGLETWGSPAPAIADDPLAKDSKALRYQWRSGAENYNGSYVNLVRLAGALQSKVCIRIRLRQDQVAANGGIQKIIRFRGEGDRPIGTVNIQWGRWLFFGDSLGDGQNHMQSPALLDTLGPDTLRGKYRYVEACADHSGPHHVWVWVDGQLVIDYAGGYNAPPIHGAHILGTFNAPADSRADWVDEIVVSRSRIGI